MLRLMRWWFWKRPLLINWLKCHLLSWSIVGGGDSVEGVEVIRGAVVQLVLTWPVLSLYLYFLLFLIMYSYFKWVNHLVLRRPQEAGLHPRVAPQPLHNHPQLVRELPVLSWSWCHRKELSRIVLRENMSITNQLRLCIQSKDANVSVSRFKTMHLFIQDYEDASPMNPNPMFGTTFHLCRSLCKLFLNSCLRTSQQYECLARS